METNSTYIQKFYKHITDRNTRRRQREVKRMNARMASDCVCIDVILHSDYGWHGNKMIINLTAWFTTSHIYQVVCTCQRKLMKKKIPNKF